MIRRLVFILLILIAANALAQQRYTVTLQFDADDDPEVITRQLAAMYRLQVDPADVGASTITITATEPAIGMLRNDRRVVSVDAVRPSMVEANAEGFGIYSYDGAGNITQAGDDTFVYDTRGRIDNATIAGIKQTFTYDRWGNITTIATDGESNRTIGVSPNNRLSGASYDGSGNLTSYHGGTFTYDALNVVRESTPTGGNRHLYLYSASNERIATIELVGAQQQSDWTIRDDAGKVLRRFKKSLSGAWSWEEDYIYRGTLLLAAEVPSSEKVRHFHLDHLGTPRLITGNGGAVLAGRSYGAFGRGLHVESTAGADELAQFTGHERDSFQLDYMHARYYDPMIGRFLAVDPGKDWDMRQPQSWNMYAYVQNNPVNNIDPDGKACLPCLVPVAIAAHRAYPVVVSGAQRAYIFASNPANVQRVVGAVLGLLDLGSRMDSATKPGEAGGDTAGKRFPKSVQEQAANEARDADGQTHCQNCDVPTSEPGARPTEAQIKGNTDHIVPRSRGGNATPGNAQHTCETCNTSAGANPKPKTTGADKLKKLQERDIQ